MNLNLIPNNNMNLVHLFILIISSLSWPMFYGSEAISAYWSPILPQFCSPNTSKNITQELFACDQLMDDRLTAIFDECVRMVNHYKYDKLNKPKLCYYLKSGMQLDRCKMARYQTEGISLSELVDKEQDHTWCLMKIAEPLGWEGLCSDNSNYFHFLMAKQNAIQKCEQHFAEITNPIKDCYQTEIVNSKVKLSTNNQDRYRPAACLSFQYSRKIWKCLARKGNQQIMQRRGNLYINCLKSIRQSMY